MALRQDVTLLPTLLLASMTVYGFLLVWAQNDPIEFTTATGDYGHPMSPVGFNIGTGGNVSIELAPWHTTSMVPAVITPAGDATVNMDSTPTAASSLSVATIPLPTASTNNSGARASPAVTRSPGISPGTAGNANTIPRSIKRSRAATNSTGRVSIKVKIQSSAPKNGTLELFLQQVCELFQTLKLEDVQVTLGPERTTMLCFPSKQ
ncbi:uncharacterized protein [Eleutherodactylus coqui]|uniref:uncharacterized protein n=1 Tax=Eleutherodactylus coqui TaxID=57060 RepID=UPI00346225BF